MTKTHVYDVSDTGREQVTLLPSNRQHLFSNNLLKVKTECYRTVLCCILYHKCTQFPAYSWVLAKRLPSGWRFAIRVDSVPSCKLGSARTRPRVMNTHMWLWAVCLAGVLGPAGFDLSFDFSVFACFFLNYRQLVCFMVSFLVFVYGIFCRFFSFVVSSSAIDCLEFRKWLLCVKRNVKFYSLTHWWTKWWGGERVVHSQRCSRAFYLFTTRAGSSKQASLWDPNIQV